VQTGGNTSLPEQHFSFIKIKTRKIGLMVDFYVLMRIQLSDVYFLEEEMLLRMLPTLI
jgi:hypothetical protein